MGKFEGYLFCTDCDGTLTDHRQRLSAENRDAIRYFQSEGGCFTVATGRYPGYITTFAPDFVPNAPIVVCNGALLYDLERDCALQVHYMGERLGELITYAFEHLPTVAEFCLSAATEDAGNFVRDSFWPELSRHEYFSKYAPVSGPEQIIAQTAGAANQMVRLSLVQDEAHTLENSAHLKRVFSQDFSMMVSWNCGLECLPKGCGKGQMIEGLRDHLGGHIHTVVCAGDNDNDRTMLRMADIGYAVDNAPDFVKADADRVTVSCEESAIARIIEELGKT